jgi:hypothetical protein
MIINKAHHFIKPTYRSKQVLHKVLHLDHLYYYLVIAYYYLKILPATLKTLRNPTN